MRAQAGAVPTGTVVVTVNVPVSITLRVLSPLLRTYSFLPSGVSARAIGFVPTGMRWVTTSELPPMTATVFVPELATYILLRSVVARKTGREPAGSVVVSGVTPLKEGE